MFHRQSPGSIVIESIILLSCPCVYPRSSVRAFPSICPRARVRAGPPWVYPCPSLSVREIPSSVWHRPCLCVEYRCSVLSIRCPSVSIRVRQWSSVPYCPSIPIRVAVVFPCPERHKSRRSVPRRVPCRRTPAAGTCDSQSGHMPLLGHGYPASRRARSMVGQPVRGDAY